MQLRGLLMLLISLALAGFAAVAANRWMSERLAGAGVHEDMAGVVAAATEIPFGTKIDETLIKIVELPVDAVPAKAFVEPEAVIGKVAAFTLFNGEILMDGRVAEHVGGSALAAVVAEGKRAITVRVDDVMGVAGFLLPGNRVDVIATRRRGGGGRGTEARTILQNMKVLAVDQTASPDKNAPVIVRAVTLEAWPKEAEEIVRATQEGKVQLALRNPLDGSRRAPEPVAAATPEATTEPAPAALPPTRSRREVVVVIRGTSESETVFGDVEETRVDFAR
ncbi:Flp pilus assembly protein CpaB [uncultured Thiohalocapsa sp.]|uniref:Flp pilus assembly protein CpaB n=1 Tax=uncultured Thiohalocapsa sp. TaxID=768990 RepID=UPI0025E117F8|nr:Flp pilus assembly protein CpaB [uncultured Thiohalocapsa sp.]